MNGNQYRAGLFALAWALAAPLQAAKKKTVHRAAPVSAPVVKADAWLGVFDDGVLTPLGCMVGGGWLNPWSSQQSPSSAPGGEVREMPLKKLPAEWIGACGELPKEWGILVAEGTTQPVAVIGLRKPALKHDEENLWGLKVTPAPSARGLLFAASGGAVLHLFQKPDHDDRKAVEAMFDHADAGENSRYEFGAREPVLAAGPLHDGSRYAVYRRKLRAESGTAGSMFIGWAMLNGPQTHAIAGHAEAQDPDNPAKISYDALADCFGQTVAITRATRKDAVLYRLYLLGDTDFREILEIPHALHEQ